MIGLLCFALAVLASPFKSTLRLEAENAVLRHQLIVLRRRQHGRVRFTNNDRWFFIQLYRWFPSILQALSINPIYGAPLRAVSPRSLTIKQTHYPSLRPSRTASLTFARSRRSFRRQRHHRHVDLGINRQRAVDG